MVDGLISIVVPIYSVEKYLNRCINSIVNQTYTRLEILLVDDGSPDQCPKMCDEWAMRDTRIRVIHKANAGLGMARNTGIDNANGEYIFFFDSDDYIALDTVEKAYALALREKSDIVVFGFSEVSSNGMIGKSFIPQTNEISYFGKEVQQTFLPDLIAPDVKTGKYTNLWMSAWASMYSLDLIKKASWRFVSERKIISEDIYSLLDLYKHVNRVSVLSEALYYYCENADSLTHVYKPDRYSMIKNFYDECYALAEKHGYSEEVLDRISYPYFSNTIGAMKMIVASIKNKDLCQKALKEIIDDEHLQSVLRRTDLMKESKARKYLLLIMKKRRHNICYYLFKLKVR